ncbi:zf-TFIIB domain-containing protein [Vibrio sp.]|nr:zf-TFIIB domain-containing protein [Vibrio sp.]
MLCPNCESMSLQLSDHINLLRTYSCSDCNGDWILPEDFAYWLKHVPQESKFIEPSFVRSTKQSGKQCPMTGQFMTTYVYQNNDVTHSMYYSQSVGGIWLDDGEWDYLLQRNLTTALQSILFSSNNVGQCTQSLNPTESLLP